MMQYTIQHKHCGMIKVIEGYTIWDAFRSFGINPQLWSVISFEEK